MFRSSTLMVSALLLGLVWAGSLPASADNSASVRPLGTLLLEYEQATKYTAQDDDWRGTREEWAASVRNVSSVRDLGHLLLQFESSITWDYMYASWRTRRDGWMNDVRNCDSLSRLGALMAEFENAVKWEAQESAWRDRREAWTNEVTAAAGGRSTPSTSPQSSSPTGASGSSVSLSTVSALLTEFERNVKFDAQNSAWRNRREAWTSEVAAAQNPAQLGRLLADLAKSMKPASMGRNWNAMQAAWNTASRSATSASQLGQLILDFENQVTWSAQEDGWRARRDDWRTEVQSSTGAAGSSSTSGTTPGSSSTTSPGTSSGNEDGAPVDQGIDPGRMMITEPGNNTSTTQNVITVSGTVANSAVSLISLDVNGSLRTVNVTNGAFTSQVPLVPGENIIQARSGGSTSNSITINARIAVAAIWTEMTWNGKGDVDFHLYGPGDEHCYYSNKQTPSGAVLDVDNRGGFGPEHITMENGVAGEYRVSVLYYGQGNEGGTGGPLSWRVQLRLGNNQPQTFSGTLGNVGEEQTVTTFTLGGSSNTNTHAGGAQDFSGWDPALIHEVSPSHEAAGQGVRAGRYFVYVAKKIPNKNWTHWRWMKYGPFDLQGAVRYTITENGMLGERSRDADPGQSSLWYANRNSRDWYAFYVQPAQ